MVLKEESTQIGYIQKTHGVKGELSLVLIDSVFTDDFEPEFLLLDIDRGLVPFYVEGYRIKSNKSILVKLENVNSEDKATQLCGTEVYIENSMLDSENMASNASYVGFKVNDVQKGFIGEITEVQEISNNPLFALNFEGKEILFPINPDFILDVDESNKSIKVDLPEGLVDLYLNDSETEEDEF